MWNGDRGRLPVGPAVQILLIVLALAGCAALGAAVGSSAALQEAGHQNAGVNISTGSGQPAGGMVQVSYRRGPSGNDQQDAQDAELIIWHTLRYRFGALVIVKTAGGCAGLVCVSESGVVARATYAQLAARFGPRPRGLDVTSGTSPIGFPGWAVALVVALAVAVLAAATVVMAMILRSKPRASRPTRTPSPGPPGASENEIDRSIGGRGI